MEINENECYPILQDQLTQSVRVKLKDLESQLELDPSLSEEEKAAKLKSEKIKIALEKLKKARVQKVSGTNRETGWKGGGGRERERKEW